MSVERGSGWTALSVFATAVRGRNPRQQTCFRQAFKAGLKQVVRKSLKVRHQGKTSRQALKASLQDKSYLLWRLSYIIMYIDVYLYKQYTHMQIDLAGLSALCPTLSRVQWYTSSRERWYTSSRERWEKGSGVCCDKWCDYCFDGQSQGVTSGCLWIKIPAIFE